MHYTWGKVYKVKKVKGYIRFEELKNAMRLLDNAQDRFILIAIYNGIAGKSNMEDLLNLKVEDVDFINHKITLRDRVVVMDELLEKTLSEAIEQTTMYSELPTGHGTEEIELNMESPYVIKVRPRAMNLWGLEPLKYSGFRVRFANIKSITGIEVNASQLETSGMINELLKMKRKWTSLDIEFELRVRNRSFNAYRIYSIMKEIE